MYICIYVYMYICTYAHLYILYVCMYVCMYVSTDVYIYIYIHTYMHTYIHACMQACMHTHLCGYMTKACALINRGVQELLKGTLLYTVKQACGGIEECRAGAPKWILFGRLPAHYQGAGLQGVGFWGVWGLGCRGF